jgi:hypothetical protein
MQRDPTLLESTPSATHLKLCRSLMNAERGTDLRPENSLYPAAHYRTGCHTRHFSGDAWVQGCQGRWFRLPNHPPQIGQQLRVVAISALRDEPPGIEGLARRGLDRLGQLFRFGAIARGEEGVHQSHARGLGR